MKVLVYDVAAEDGGGLFVLKNFYEQVLAYPIDGIEWVFMTSIAILEEATDITVLSYGWIKKSWFHRLFFEKLVLPGVLKDIKPDIVFSLQNMPVRYGNAKQIVYLHQSLQYCPKKFSFFKKEEFALAIRQKIICNIYKKNLHRADHIFVQTQWIKEATTKWLGISESQITVVPVALGEMPKFLFSNVEYKSNVFFYPARGVVYKNHKVVIEACRLLEERGIIAYKVIFTLTPDESTYASQLKEMAKGLPIEFVGIMQYERVWQQYQRSILLFPSYLETCGLPLLEARSVGSMIIASDMPFSHEALAGYENVQYFEYDNARRLSEIMENTLKKKTHHIGPCKPEKESISNDLLQSILTQIK